MKSYINKSQLIEAINKLIESRRKKAQCSRAAAEQLNAFIFVLRVIEKLDSVVIDD